MAPSATDYPLDSPYHVRVAFDPEVGPNTGQNQPSQDVPSGDHPMLKHLTPRFKNLTPWPYVAVAAISLILLFVLGYALSNCYRRMKTCKPLDSGSASLQRIGLIERKGTIGRSGNSKSSSSWGGKLNSPEGVSDSPIFASKGFKDKSSGVNSLANSVTLPSSCYIPYTPTSLSLAHDAQILPVRGALRDRPSLDPRRSRTKSAILAFKKKTARN